MIIIFSQDRRNLIKVEGVVACDDGKVRGLTSQGWTDLGQYDDQKEAELVVANIYGIVLNEGKSYRMPKNDEIIGRWV